MGILGHKPNVESLARREDLEGLVEATCYRELVRTSSDTVNDQGIPVRTGAILALGELGPDAGEEAVALALRDPADRVRCAAVRVCMRAGRPAYSFKRSGGCPSARANPGPSPCGPCSGCGGRYPGRAWLTR
jgi:HEAT repeat protein